MSTMKNVFRLAENVKADPHYGRTAITTIDGKTWRIFSGLSVGTPDAPLTPHNAKTSKSQTQIFAYEKRNPEDWTNREITLEADGSLVDSCVYKIERNDNGGATGVVKKIEWEPAADLLQKILVAYDEALEKRLIREPK